MRKCNKTNCKKKKKTIGFEFSVNVCNDEESLDSVDSIG